MNSPAFGFGVWSKAFFPAQVSGGNLSSHHGIALADFGSLAMTNSEGILGELSQDSCKSLLLVPVIEWNCRDDSPSVTKGVTEMCESQSQKGCEHPEKLKDRPGQCSPEQIKECHGDVKKHPCVKEK
jgi:hypothetical protein